MKKIFNFIFLVFCSVFCVIIYCTQNTKVIDMRIECNNEIYKIKKSYEARIIELEEKISILEAPIKETTGDRELYKTNKHYWDWDCDRSYRR